MKVIERTTSALLGPVFGISEGAAYEVPRAGAPTDLKLDGNEGRAPHVDPATVFGPEIGELLRRYPSSRGLERLLARRLGVRPEEVLVTSGADDAILRACTALLGPDRELVLPVPTFEMIERYARLRGCTIREVPWRNGSYPTAEVIEASGPRTSLVAVVSPNNPTGAVATAEDLRRLSEALPQAVLLVDLAYVEFADEDLTAAALELPNAVVLRTLSKAHGLAGLRVGYAAGAERVIDWLRQAGNPYPVAGLSLALAAEVLGRQTDAAAAYRNEVRRERQALSATIDRLGGAASPSRANFVLARFRNAAWVRDALAGMGIAVRAFPGRPYLENALRITCPGSTRDEERLERALETVLAPQALLFDLDGVLADVSRSYRVAIVETARSFGIGVTAEDVSALKREGEANDDWSVTHTLLARAGVEVSLAEVTRRFEELYQGTEAAPGLRAEETLTVKREWLEQLHTATPLGVVTGRPRADALRFLEEHGIADLFEVFVCREDAPLKPDPAPLELALKRLGVTRAWYLGDTVDDVRAARAAGLLPVGVIAPGERLEESRRTLVEAGAARALARLSELEELGS